MSKATKVFLWVLGVVVVVTLGLVIIGNHKTPTLGGDFNSVTIDFNRAWTISGKKAGGYITGSGCAVTQATNRTTGVICNAPAGQITTNNTSLAAGAEAEFTITDSTVNTGDTVIVSLMSGATANTSIPFIAKVANGSFDIELTNLNAATADTGASLINFAVIKAASN